MDQGLIFVTCSYGYAVQIMGGKLTSKYGFSWFPRLGSCCVSNFNMATIIYFHILSNLVFIVIQLLYLL
jgi:hypothetical protein